MRRLIMVLTVTAMLLATLLTVPAVGQDFGPDGGTKGGDQEPQPPVCDWYGPYSEPPWDPWWEYWCWWPGWGWEFVFWVYD